MAKILKRTGIVHDIDGNLSDTHGYWFEAFHRAGFALPPGYTGLKQVMSDFRLPKDVPGWWGPEGKDLNEILLISEQAHTDFPPMPRSNEVANRLNQKYGTAMYLTGRDVALEQVTREWLFKTNRFPKAPVRLRPKNTPIDKADRWKADILVRYADEICGITEDSAGIAKALPDDWPGFICLLGYSEDEVKGLHPNAIACQDWAQIETAIDGFLGA